MRHWLWLSLEAPPRFAAAPHRKRPIAASPPCRRRQNVVVREAIQRRLTKTVEQQTMTSWGEAVIDSAAALRLGPHDSLIWCASGTRRTEAALRLGKGSITLSVCQESCSFRAHIR